MRISYKPTQGTNEIMKFFKFSPTQIICWGFIALILTGAILLTLPVSSAGGHGTGFIDALFTSTSAACVTGLVVYDTNTYWSPFGKVVIISLIQIGGLGIMSMSTIFALIMRRKIGVKERLVIQESINEFSLSGVVRTIKNIMLLTFVFETLGAIILSTQFIPVYGFRHGLQKSFFHSISAFCNAGFDLIGQEGAKFASLVPFQNNPVILLTIAFLIIFGGLGFIVWKDLYNRKKLSHLSLHSKVVLIGTAFLIVSGTFLLILFEFDNTKTIGNMSFGGKLLNSFFSAVTPRTAGFNSVNISDLKDSSNFLTIILMFIGAAPGSTGGGIKVTTFSVILFTVFSSVRGCSDVNILKKKIAPSVITKAISITSLSMVVVIITTMVLTLYKEGTFLQCLYEATSAFATVGLTAGITPGLETVSKIFVSVTMFLGRVGPLSAAIAFSLKQKNRNDLFRYPEGRINVG